MKRKLCEPLRGGVAGTRVLTEAEVVARGYPKRDGVLGYVDGIFSVCDKENKNKRMYETQLWEEVHGSDRFKQMVGDMTLLGEPDHPETRTQSAISEGSHTIVDQYIEDGYVKGTVMIFDNDKARCFWPMLKAGVKLGFSTRGDGDLVEDSRSGRTKVDPKSYEYHGVDFVLNPSFVEAGPTAINESTWGKTLTALTEAVQKHVVTEETERNVKSILEAMKPENFNKSRLVEDSGVSRSGNTKAIEAVVAQLTEANNKNVELQESLDNLKVLAQDTQTKHAKAIETLTAELQAKDDTLAEAVASATRLEEQLTEARGDLRRLSEGTKGKVDAARVSELKALLAENQRSHLSLVKTHKGLVSKHRKLEASHEEGLKVIGELRKRLAEADERAKGAEERATEALTECTEAKNELEANRTSIPEIISNSTLEQYKKLRTEGLEVPAEFTQLLEHAANEQEVDTIVNAIKTTQASRYSFLPLGPNSRGLREALAESIPEESATGSGATKERDAEAELTREVTRRQLGRGPKKG